MKITTYNTEQYPFIYLVEKILGVAPLNTLHETLNRYPDVVIHKTDQSTEIHKRYYANQYILLPVFQKFVKEVIRPLFNEEILYQSKPTFRCQLPGNLSVGAFHKDSDYSHDKKEVNFFLALTRCFDTNTIWVESESGKKDYSPINLNIGEILMFDGANLEHGNKLNKTGLTRVSIDFRVLPKSSYNPNNNHVTTNIKKKMIIGDYFDIC